MYKIRQKRTSWQLCYDLSYETPLWATSAQTIAHQDHDQPGQLLTRSTALAGSRPVGEVVPVCSNTLMHK